MPYQQLWTTRPKQQDATMMQPCHGGEGKHIDKEASNTEMVEPKKIGPNPKDST
jgi:hypothetical protein